MTSDVSVDMESWLPVGTMISALLFQFLLLLAAACNNSLDCSLNGICDVSTSICTCDPAWKGMKCSTLNLLPLEPSRVISGAYRPGKRTSWGANVLHSKEDGKYHMFVAEMKGECTLTSWIPNSQVVHAVSNTLEGPFEFKEVLFDTFHHNPRLAQNPHDGSYLLFMIGGNASSTSGVPGNCSSIPPSVGELLDTRIVVSRAASLNGPWSEPTGPLLERGKVDEWDYVVTNPTPIILLNGTTLLYYRGTPKYWNDDEKNDAKVLDLPESIGVAIAPTWKGPYKKVFAKPILKVMNEDPFAYINTRGDFHLLTHGRSDWWNTHHSYSQDGLTWSDGSDVATDPNWTMTNGTIYRFTNRERPQIYFNETTGEPAILFNGVCPGAKYTYAYTLAQNIYQGE